MKLVVICNLPPPAGGAEVFARDLVLSLAQSGFKLTLLTHDTLEIQMKSAQRDVSYRHDATLCSALVDSGIEIIPALRPWSEVEGYDLRVARITEFLRQIEPDLVHCHMPTGYLPEATAACRELGIPLVSTLHGMTNLVPRFGSSLGNQWTPAKILKLITQADHTVVVSKPMLEYCHEKAVGNVTFIPGGVDLEYFTPAPKTARHGVIYVGKLNSFKGLRQAIAGFLRVANRISDKLYLVGRGITEEYFRSTGFLLTSNQRTRVASLIDEGRIVLVGEIPTQKLKQYLQSSRLFVLPSLTEGLPISMLEALACGTPVIVSRVGSVPDVVQDGVNGKLIDAGSIRQLAAAMLSLPECDSDFSARCRSSVQQYNIATVCDSYIRLFNSLAR